MKPSKTSSRKNILLLSLGVVILLAGIMATLELTNTTHLFHKSHIPAGSTTSDYTKGEQTSGNTTSGSQDNTGSTKTGDDNTETAALVQPNGNFVSSHHVSSGSNETSACNTTPGAKCSITFTNGSVTKSLAAQTTDAGGATYWNWTPASAGLNSGTWHVQAVATLGSQKLTADDALSLQVQ